MTLIRTTVQQTKLVPPEQKNGVDPMAIRWGFNAVVNDRKTDFLQTGLTDIPRGQFFPIQRFPVMREVHTTDPNKPKESIVWVSAQEAEDSLLYSLGGRNDAKLDFGLRIGFYNEQDSVKMDVLSAVLVPSLSEIREIAGDEVSHICEGQDDLDFTGREYCPTCLQQWLNSDACKKHYTKAAEDGVAVNILEDDGTEKERIVKLKLAEYEKAYELIVTSLRVGIIAIRNQWQEIATEIERGERKQTDIYQNGVRKDLHALKPEERQMATLAKIASNTGSVTSPELAKILELLTTKQVQTDEFIAQIAAKEIGEPAVFTPAQLARRK